MSDKNTDPSELDKNPNTKVAESKQSPTDTPLKGTEQPWTKEIKPEDFWDQKTAEELKTEDDESRRKLLADDQRMDWRIDMVFNKYVKTSDWKLDFSWVPTEFQWLVPKIEQRYFQPEGNKTDDTNKDLTKVVNQQLELRDYKNLQQEIIKSDDFDKTQKLEIASKYKELKAQWIKSDLYALTQAKETITNQTRQISWTIPDVWKAPDLTRNTYTSAELSRLPQDAYNSIMDKVESWAVHIVW